MKMMIDQPFNLIQPCSPMFFFRFYRSPCPVKCMAPHKNPITHEASLLLFSREYTLEVGSIHSPSLTLSGLTHVPRVSK